MSTSNLGAGSLICLAFSPTAHAQTSLPGEDVCATTAPVQQGASPGTIARHFPTAGTVNALVLFVQNRNDTQEDDCYDSTRRPIQFREFPASVCAGQPDTPHLQSTSDDPVSEWPQGRSTTPARTLPSWGAEFLARPETDPAEFAPGSLSEYYHLNSGGRFTLTGYVYPEVYIPDHDPS